MQSKDAHIFISCTSSDFQKIQPILCRLKTNGWHLVCGVNHAQKLLLPVCPIEDCDLVLTFVSIDYITIKDTFVSELSYAACAQQKPYILVALEAMETLPSDMEMLAAKNGFIDSEHIESSLERWLNIPQKELTPINTKRRYAFKPFEASDEHYAFVSYAHDDAFSVYPIIKELYETGWNLWYDEGIRITERYLPEIAKHIQDCEVFLLFVTEYSIRRLFVIHFELAYAKKLGKKIVPIMMELVDWFPEEIVGLSRVVPNETLQQALADSGIKNYGKRTAVPPKDKKGEDYDLKQLIPMKDYQYRLSGDGIFLTKYTGKDINVIIPNEHCGLPVCTLEGTFYNNRKIKSVECPDTIKLIKDKTFQKCYSLQSITYKAPNCEIAKYAYDPDFSDLLPGKTFIFSLLCGIGFSLYVLLSISPHSQQPSWLSASIFPYVKIALAVCSFFSGFGGSLLGSALIFPIINAIKKRINLWKKKFQLIINEPNRTQNDVENAKALALAYFCEDSLIFDELEKLRADGFLIKDWVGGTKVDFEYKIVIVFLTAQFLYNNEFLEALYNDMSENKKIIPIYWSIQPTGLSQQLASTLGQIQGLFPDTQEFNYLIKRSLKDMQCWRNLMSDYEFTVKKNAITLKRYIGNATDTVFIPKQAFDPPQLVNSIDYCCFSYYSDILHKCTKIKKIYIPDSIKKIDLYAFDGCHGLEEIYVHNENTHYYSENGILCNSEKRTSVYCPKGFSKRILLSNRTKSIGNCTFEGRRKIEEVIIQNGVEKIGNYAFWGCIALHSIFIPASIKKIGKDQFLSSGIFETHNSAKVHTSNFSICPKLTIHTPIGSFAEQYAKKNNIPYKAYTLEKWEELQNNQQN